MRVRVRDLLDAFAVAEVPDPEGFIVRARVQELPRMMKAKSPDPIIMSDHCDEALSVPTVPQFNGFVSTSGD